MNRTRQFAAAMTHAVALTNTISPPSTSARANSTDQRDVP